MKIKQARRPRPSLVGAGFIALDMVYPEGAVEPRFFAGGTTGNLLANTAFLGWNSIAFGRLDADYAGVFVNQDLASFGVDTSKLHSSPACATPIVIQRNYRGKDGKARHSFGWTCPDCGAYLPGYRALLADTAAQIIQDDSAKASVFFTDRVSRSTLLLAQHFKKAGAVIFFEPSTLGDPGQFVEMLQVCDVLKYSNQRAKSFSDYLPESRAALEIQTLGEEGLRFRIASKSHVLKWTALPSFDTEVRDTAGAGDWTSAGTIVKLFALGRFDLKALTKARVQSALEYGQALAALNCRFEGARGLMYSSTLDAITTSIKRLKLANIAEHLKDESNPVPSSVGLNVCRACGEPDEPKIRKSRSKVSHVRV